MLRTILSGLFVLNASAAFADDPVVNLFETPGEKQDASSFEPAPERIETKFGTLSFTGGGVPTPETARLLYDEIDLQRATQAYMDFLPHVSLYAIVKSQIRDLGFETSSDIGVTAEFMTPQQPYLTGNNSTIYAFASIDLKIDGPTVVEIPPGMYGTANDAAFRYLTDFGATGPDKGEGGKYLFLPPDHEGEAPEGYFVFEAPGYRIWAMMRGFGDVGTGDQALTWFGDRLKVYPLESGPRDGAVINASQIGMNPLPPENVGYFEMLHEIIQHEPASLFDPEQLGRLAALGIIKGSPFAPDDRMRAILDQGAKQGVAMSRAILYASREPEIRYWPERQWEKMFVRNTEFVVDGRSDIDARTLWHYQAIVVSPNLLSKTPGVGTAYLTAARDGSGAPLDGAATYTLTVPPNPPVKRFWAVTAYDPATRALLDSDGPITVGSLGDPVVKDDGSVDIHFGPEPVEGMENNWIRTHPEKGFFVVFRFYGPLEGYIEKSWIMNDFFQTRE
ncbi:MAG: DUF1254 domain-containing protein [Pseudomonadota bacterium]